MTEPPAHWASVSDLAEYAYCPRAWYYRAHPPPEGRTSASDRASSAGERYHRAELSRVEFDESHGAGYGALVLVALVLIAGALWWIWH